MAMLMHDYLRYRCSEMLAAEKDILKMLDKMTVEVQHPRLKQLFEQHRLPTQQQIRNLEQAVNRLGGVYEHEEGFFEKITESIGVGERGSSPVTKAMMASHEAFLSMNPSQEIIDLHDCLEGAKVEHMEIASYKGLIALAQHANETEIVQLLQHNLTGEQEARSLIEGELPTLLSDLIGYTTVGARRAA